ncbi:hypothetical protein BF128_004577 [Escherichia coli]|nr:hypothetical protein [Escherichia coli]
MVRWLRMVAELEADARVQQMHRDNIAKRQALMLAEQAKAMYDAAMNFDDAA